MKNHHRDKRVKTVTVKIVHFITKQKKNFRLS